jgi:EAL domain-containing protein (putative c-di-GMP-specific phosphodiesterase class I)
VTTRESIPASAARDNGTELGRPQANSALRVRLAAKAVRLQSQVRRYRDEIESTQLMARVSSLYGAHPPSAEALLAPATLSDLERFAVTLNSEALAAVRRDAFHYEYQPIVSCTSDTLEGYEALVRWRRGGETLLPAEFLPIVEETGAIAEIQQRLLRSIAAAQLQLSPSVFIANNWSPAQLANAAAVSAFLHLVRDLQIDPTRLVIEVTEHTVTADPQAARANITRLKDAGARIALDDFGKGYCGLSYLRSLPIDHIKIDRSLTADLERSSRSRTIVESIIELAHRLGSSVVAEGVETLAQRSLLARLDCDYVQGFLIGFPSRHLLPCAAAAAPTAVRSAVSDLPEGSGTLPEFPMELLAESRT